MLGTMARCIGGSVATSYNQVVMERSKDMRKKCFNKPLEKATGASNTDMLGGNKPHE